MNHLPLKVLFESFQKDFSTKSVKCRKLSQNYYNFQEFYKPIRMNHREKSSLLWVLKFWSFGVFIMKMKLLAYLGPNRMCRVTLFSFSIWYCTGFNKFYKLVLVAFWVSSLPYLNSPLCTNFKKKESL